MSAPRDNREPYMFAILMDAATVAAEPRVATSIMANVLRDAARMDPSVQFVSARMRPFRETDQRLIVMTVMTERRGPIQRLKKHNARRRKRRAQHAL